MRSYAGHQHWAPSSAPLYRVSSAFADKGGPQAACVEFQKRVFSGGVHVSNCAAFPAAARKPMLLCLQIESKKNSPIIMYEKSNISHILWKYKYLKNSISGDHKKILFFSLSSTQLAGKGSGRATASLQTNQPAPFPSPLWQAWCAPRGLFNTVQSTFSSRKLFHQKPFSQLYCIFRSVSYIPAHWAYIFIRYSHSVISRSSQCLYKRKK